jgi:hypothetical protein
MTTPLTVDEICPVRGNPPGNYHFTGYCEDCDAYFLSRLTFGQVEIRYHDGRVSQDQFEAYMHCWATGAFRYSNLGVGWTDPPADPIVVRIVARIRRYTDARKGTPWPTSTRST